MRISEVVAKVAAKPYSAFAAGMKAGEKVLTPSQWGDLDSDKTDPNLVQNIHGFAQGKDVIDMILQGITLYPADVNNVKTIANQVKGGQLAVPPNVNKQVLMSALRKAASGDVLEPKETATLKLFHQTAFR